MDYNVDVEKYISEYDSYKEKKFSLRDIVFLTFIFIAIIVLFIILIYFSF